MRSIIGRYAASVTLEPKGLAWLFNWKASPQASQRKSTTRVPLGVGERKSQTHAGQ